jgi:aminoglycoside 6'-N-acetyltransferase
MDVALRPLMDHDLDALVAMVREPSVARWWSPLEDEAKLRADLVDDEPFAILADGELAGWVAAWEDPEPSYRHGGLDIFLGERFQDRGIGRAALRLAARHQFDVRGHHRITIDPAVANTRAIAAYEAIGFRRVGVMRRYERGPDGQWRDGLLMDMLEGELR